MSAEILSPVSGTVWKVEVVVGQEVEDGDEFMILESMKMEIPVLSEMNCVVKELLCIEGDQVAEGQVLLIVEET